MQLIRPSTPLFEQVHVASTTRLGGISLPPYDSLNVGDHVGDDPQHVQTNRERLLAHLGITHAQWLKQVHGTQCVLAESKGDIKEADACWTDQSDLACVVMTADCLPVVFSDGERIAVAHAGWRGLVSGVLENTLACFSGESPSVWLGPAIGPTAFEVGPEVREQFCDQLSASSDCFTPSPRQGKWMAHIYHLARLRLSAAGIDRISGGEHCTFTDAERFYSYRRTPQTGRMATLIWKSANSLR